MSIGRYCVGLLLSALCLGAVATGTRALRSRLLPSLSGSPAWTADGLIGCSLIVLVVELSGLLGVLGRVAVVVGCVAAGALAWVVAGRWRRGSPGAEQRRPGRAPEAARSAVVVMIAAGAVVAAPWLGWTIYAYRHGMETVDTLWYHLPFAARFAQTGSIVHLHYVDANPVTVFYPATSELFHAFGLVLFGSDVLSPLINLGWAALALAAAHAIGRPYGRGPQCVLAVLLLLATPQLIDTQPGGAYNDVTDVALMLAAAAVLADGAVGAIKVALASAAGGMALGTKFTMIVPVIALGVGLVAISRRGHRLRHGSIAAVAWLVLGGCWYVRNAIAVGNPLPALSVHLGPLSLPAPHVSTPTFTVAQYLTNGQVWRTIFLPGLRQALGPGWWAIVVLAAVGAGATLVRARDGVLRMLAGLAAVSALAFVLTPQFLGIPGIPLFFVDNVRYAAVPLALGLVLLPIHPLLGSRRAGTGWLAVAGALLVATEIDPGVWPTGLRLKPFAQPIGGAPAVGGAALAVLGGALALGLAWLEARGPAPLRARSARHRLPNRAMALAAAGALALSGWFLASSYASRRYAASPPLPRIYAWARQIHDARIGIVGLVQQYPLAGLDSSNFVQYVGESRPHGGFAQITSCPVWRETIDRGRYRWLVVAPAGFPLTQRAAPEVSWTGSSPAATRVIVEHAAAGAATVVLFRLRGPLDPRGCA